MSVYDAEIEYLKSTGDQYIDTGINLQNIGKVYVELKYPYLSNRNNGDGAATGDFYSIIGVVTPDNGSTFYYGTQFGASGNEVLSTQRVDEGWHTIELDVINGLAVFDGVEQKSLTIASSIPSMNWYLFIRNGILNRKLPSYRKNCKIWDRNNNLIRDYIPARVGSVGYLYDKVSEQLFGNIGTGNFILGKDKVLPNPFGFRRRLMVVKNANYYEDAEYIENTSTAYIDTGYIPNNNTSVSCEFEVVDTITVEANWLFRSAVGYANKDFGFLIRGGGENETSFRFGSKVLTKPSQYLQNGEYTLTSNKNSLTVVGSTTQTFTPANNTFTCNYSLVLFASNTGTISGYSHVRMKNFKIYDDVTIVRDYVPKRNDKGIYGFYENISETFNTSPNGVLFSGQLKV